MNELEQAKAKAAATYNAAADYFDHPVSSFWHRFGRETIDRLDLLPGAQVLDVCSGSGGSALPAAEKVGSDGRVIASDLAGGLIALAEQKAKDKALENIEFRVADMLNLGYADASFDAVVCVFGIFFVPDMAGAVRELWRMVRPGGKLAITTWGPSLFEPASSLFWEAIDAVRPELNRGFNPWDRIDDPDGLRAMLEEAGIRDARIVAEAGTHPLNAPEDWWLIAMGSGYRGTLAQLEPDHFQQVKEANLSCLSSRGITDIETNVMYATAVKA